MLRTGTFFHGNFARRLTSYRARGPYFGENLAWGVGSRGSAASVVQMWLASPSHRANLLRRSFQRVGLGIYVGTFRGYGGTSVVTANFAGRVEGEGLTRCQRSRIQSASRSASFSRRS